MGQSREKMPAPKGFNLQQLDVAYVEDNSFFGITSPMEGHRSRTQLEKYFGAVDFYGFLFDYRKYYYFKPVNLSFRIYHYGRYGKGAENDLISPLYLGYPWLIRGYESKSFYRQSDLNGNHLDIYQLTGSKILVGNFEIRFPFSGPERLALIKSKWILTDLNLFFDSGLAWYSGEKPVLKWQQTSSSDRIPIFSAGPSLRINLFGYLVIEPFYAIPFQNGGLHNGVFGVNFIPGW
jgi:outer membrane protein assembly factor BamA